MRRILVLIALLAIMLGLRLFQAHTQAAEGALVLAAIGFVLLSSFTVAEMGSTLTLPRVTGYIITGTLLASFGILSSKVVLQMKMFNTLALGLIALAAGLELSVTQLKKVLKTLTVTTLGKVLLGVPAVFSVFYVFERYLGPLGLDSTSQIIGMGLVMGALSLGTSPAIALAVISETKSRGRLSDLVLGASVLKDLVVVVALALAVAVARGVVAAGESGGHGLAHVFVEIGYSLAAGAALGVLLILYIRYIKAEMLLFVAAIILVVAEVAGIFHLELLLVFIAGGFVVRNFSNYEHDLLDPVQMVSLPVFVVFFTIAGASIDLAATFRILPLAGALCVVRAIAYYFSARIGNSIGKEAEGVRENAWLAYLPQAGVTLGLVGLAAAQLPMLGKSIESTGMAVVALNLLVGPIALRAALKRAGEIPEGDAEQTRPSTDGGEGEENHPILRLSEPLRDAFWGVEHQLMHHFDEIFRSDWMRWSREMSERCLALGRAVAAKEEEDSSAFRKTLHTSENALALLADEHREFFLTTRRVVRTLPDVIDVPLEIENRRLVEGDSFGIRLRKRAAGIGRLLTFVRRPVRRVPVRELGRLHFEPRLAELCASAWTSRMRTVAGVLEDLTSFARGGMDQPEFEARVARRFDAWERLVRQNARSLCRRSVASLVRQAAVVDSAYLARGAVRASGAERHVHSALSDLEDVEGWVRALDAAFEGIVLLGQTERLRQHLESTLSQRVIGPCEAAIEEIAGVFLTWAEGLDTLAVPLTTESEEEKIGNPPRGKARGASTAADHVGGPGAQTERREEEREFTSRDGGVADPSKDNKILADVTNAQEEALSKDLTQAIAAFDALDARVHDEGASAFEGAMAAFRTSVDLRPVVHQVTAAVGQLPEEVVLTRAVTRASEVSSPRSLSYRRIEPRKIASARLLEDAMSEAEKFVSAAEELPRQVLRFVFALLEATRLEVRALSKELHGQLARKNLSEALSQRAQEVRAHVAELRETEQGYFSGLRSAVGRSLQELSNQLDEGGLGLGELVRGRRLGFLVESALRTVDRTLRRGARLFEQVERVIREAVRSEISQEVQAKFQGGDFDAAAIRAFLDRHAPPSVVSEYASYFLTAPLRETSQFVAHREVLREILAAEREWVSGGPSSVLIVGAPGSGRTSLLNLLQHGSFAKSLVRPHPARWRRSVGLLQALAYELGCRARPQAIEKALSGREALVIIDDLEEWIHPGALGVETLESFLELVGRTQANVFWAVSTKNSWFELASALTDVAGSFGRVKHLAPVSGKELGEMIERRHHLSDLGLVYPTTLLGKVFSRGESTRDREIFFALLARASGGNISRALKLWLHMAQEDAEGRVRPTFSRALLMGLPFLRDLSAEQCAVLVLLCRHGALSETEITGELCAGLPFVRRQLAFLMAAGLVRHDEADGLYLVPKSWGPFIEDGLRGAKAL